MLRRFHRGLVAPCLLGVVVSTVVEIGNETCPKATGGSCFIFSCGATRGEAMCVHGSCLCKPGYCNNMGACREARADPLLPQCIDDTAGTCHYLGCYGWRGATQCIDSKCVCSDGCNANGMCHPYSGTLTAKVVPVNQEHPQFPGPHGRVKTALVFSGGGSRSMTVSFGSLRALHHLGLMDHIDAISSVSGGTWAAAVYTFVDLPAQELLGPPTRPQDLSMDVLAEEPAAVGKAATVGTTSIATKYTGIASPLLWIFTISEAILGSFGLDGKDILMAATPEDVKRIKRDNPQLEDRRFVTPAPGRPPVLVMSGAILAPSGYVAEVSTVVSLQVSPDYTGAPFYPNNSFVDYTPTAHADGVYLSNRIVGGGFVETFAFGGMAPPKHQNGGEKVQMPGPIEPMSLAKALGVSSAGPASAFTQASAVADMTYLNPIANIWPVTSEKFPGPQEADSYELGDGGNVDNSGLLAMLQREAESIIWLINTEVPIPMDTDFCAVKTTEEMATLVAALEFQVRANFGYYEQNDVGQFLSHNQVFAKEELAPWLCKLQALKKVGKPTLIVEKMAIQANPWWGIRSYEATIAFVYSESCPNFEAELPEDTKKAIWWGAMGAFANFPHYTVVFQNIGEATALTVRQVNLLAAQSEYVIRQNEVLLRGLLGLSTNPEDLVAPRLDLIPGREPRGSLLLRFLPAIALFAGLTLVFSLAKRSRLRGDVRVSRQPLLA